MVKLHNQKIEVTWIIIFFEPTIITETSCVQRYIATFFIKISSGNTADCG